MNNELEDGPVPRTATTDEVEAAIASLSMADLVRLEGFAAFRVRGLGRAAEGLDPADVVTDALEKTLRGIRRWNKGAVDLAGHLMGVIRSDVSHWGEKVGRRGPTLRAADLHPPDGSAGAEPLDQVPGDAPDAERIAIAKDQVEKIRSMFAEDTVVSLIIDGLIEGMKGPEIQVSLDISQKQYEAAMKRMRRTLDRSKKGVDDATA